MNKQTEHQILEPGLRSIPEISEMAKLAEMLGKRPPAGGLAQFGAMTFEEIAHSIVPCSEGFDKQSGATYKDKTTPLIRLFRERGWPKFDRAIVIAGMRKYNSDPKDGFIPYAPGSIDIEAAINFDPKHKELQIFGRERGDNDEILSCLVELHYITGIATEYGNGEDSLEIVIPTRTDGIWEKITDLQFSRPTGIVIVTPYITLWCENMSVNNLIIMPTDITSVKMGEAIKIAKYLCNRNEIE